MPTPNDSIRTKIVENFQSTLAAIVAGATYYFTPRAVFRWRTPPLEGLDFPCYAVFDLEEKVEVKNYALQERVLAVTVQGVAIENRHPHRTSRFPHCLRKTLRKTVGSATARVRPHDAPTALHKNRDV